MGTEVEISFEEDVFLRRRDREKFAVRCYLEDLLPEGLYFS